MLGARPSRRRLSGARNLRCWTTHPPYPRNPLAGIGMAIILLSVTAALLAHSDAL